MKADSGSDLAMLSSMANLSEANATVPMRDMFLARMEVAVLATMFTVAVIGNSLALTALALRSRKLSRMHYFIMHLCISDLVVAFFHMLPQLLMDAGGGGFSGGYPGDNFLCKLVKYLALLGPCLSSYVLVVTAIDRYQAICFPLMNCSWTPRRSKVMIGAAWAVSMLLSVPQAFIFSYTVAEPYTHMDCWTKMTPLAEKLYILWNAVAVFIVPLLVLIFTYSCICRVIWINFQFKAPMPEAKPLPLNNGGSVVVGGAYRFMGKGKVEVTLHADGVRNGSGQEPGKDQVQPRAHARKGISRSKMKTVKLTVVVILCYITCSLPYFSTLLYVKVYPAPENPAILEGPAFVILLLLVSLNSCVNPWLYLIFNENLTKTLKDMFCCRLGKSKQYGLGAANISRSSVSETRSCTVVPSPCRTQNTLGDKMKLTSATSKCDVPRSASYSDRMENGNNGVARNSVSANPLTTKNSGQLCLPETKSDSWKDADEDNGKRTDVSPSDSDSDKTQQEFQLINDATAGMKNRLKNAIVATKHPKNRKWSKIQKHYCGGCNKSCNCDDV